ncbi:MAG: putative replicase [Circoviridae sp.]|nr:MAG: putative replicase [Circoviridae sp.]
MSYPFEEFFAHPHKCQKRPNEFLGTHLNTRHYDGECCNVCKCGTDFNEFFQNKPTPDEVTETAKAFYIKGLRATQIAEERKRNLFSQAQEHGQIITLNFDKDAPDRIALMDYAINEIKKANYSWLDKDAVYCYEFYSSQSPTEPDNPHIHIGTKRMVDKKGKLYKATNIAQMLRRKFAEKSKTPIKAIYGVNGEERTWKIARDYVNGSCASKSDGADGIPEGEKWKYTKQDIKYRATNKIDHPMYF